MKKMTSIILSVLLVLASLTACSNESDHKKADNQTPSTEQPAPTVFVPVKPIIMTADPSILDNATENPRDKYTIYKQKDTPPLQEEPLIDRQIIDWSNPDATTAMKEYKSILKNISYLAETASDWIETIDNCQSSIAFGAYGLLTHFAIIDLDKDQIPEVVLAFGNQKSPGVFVILKYYNNIVYAYSLSYRSFMNLKIDGSFVASGGIDFSYNTISFNELTCIVESYIERYEYSFYIYGQETTEEEYHKATSKEKNKPDITWYNYSLENIETYFP